MKKFIRPGPIDTIHFDSTICYSSSPILQDRQFTTTIPKYLGDDTADNLHKDLIKLNKNWSINCFSLYLQAFYSTAIRDTKDLISNHSECFSLFELNNPKFSSFFPDHNSDSSYTEGASAIMNTIINSLCTSALALALKENELILERLLRTDTYHNVEKFNFKIPIFDFFTTISSPAKMTPISQSKAKPQVIYLLLFKSLSLIH